MKTLIRFSFLLFFFQVYTQDNIQKIRGVVTNSDKPLSNVSILVKGTSNGVQTNKNGEYVISIKTGEVLVFRYLGMQTTELAIQERNSFLNVELLPWVEELKEVVVKKKRPFTQKELLIAYPNNKGLIKTSRGILDKDRASFSIRIFDGNKLIPVGSDFLYSLQNLYPQMKVIRNNPGSIDPNTPAVYLQSWSHKSSPQAIFDVDGFIYEKPPTFVPVSDIDRVAILVRNGAISRYGPQGAGGVIIVNTKSKAWMDDIGIKRTYNNAILRDSLLNAINELEPYFPVIPEYIEELNIATTIKEALELFEKQRVRFKDSPYYFLDVAKNLRNRWDDKKKSEELLEFMGNRFSKDISAQKALAYSYEEQGRFDNALQTYLTILNLDSRAAQSHRDVANAYYELDNYRRALAVYARYEYAINELDSIAFDVSGTDILMSTESLNIIRLNRKQLSIRNSTIEEVTTNPNTRLVFEWNNDQAEFELQFVDSDDDALIWKKTKNETEILLQNQRRKGYTTKQFFLEDTLNAEWKVNINYFGNQSELPTYLKVTTFFDYGKPTQSKGLKLFILSKENANLYLFTIDIGEKTVAN